MSERVGLAELAQLLGAFREDDVAKMCPSLGFVAPTLHVARRPQRQSVVPEAPTAPRAHVATQPPALTETAPTPLWRMEEATWRDPSSERVERAREVVESFSEHERRGAGRSFFATPRAPPLAPWSRLWPVLQRALQRAWSSNTIDVATIVRKWTCGERMIRIPMQARRAWANRVALWIDRSRRLTPFWHDQDNVRAGLVRTLGRTNVSLRYLDDAPRRPRAADQSVPVVLLGDLGAFAGEATQRAWRAAGRTLQRAGVRATALALGHVASDRGWRAEPWEPTRRTLPGTADERADALLALTAPAAFVHVGLLRALRLLLPAGHADASTEVDAWAHRDVRAADVTGLVLAPEALVRRRHEFATRVDAALRAKAVAVVAVWHRGGRQELLFEEALACEAMGERGGFTLDERENARAFACKLAAVMDVRSGRVPAAWVRDFGRRWLGALPDGVYAQVPSLTNAWRAAFRGERAVRVPDGVDAAGEAAVQEGFVALRQVGGALRIERVESSAWPSPAATPGSPLACVRGEGETVVVTVGKHGARRQYRVGDEVALPDGVDGEVRVESDRCAVVLRARVRETWMHAMGRDRYGLWAEVRTKGVPWRMRWVPPGRFVMGSPESEVGRNGDELQHEVTLTKGYWVGETPVTQALWEVVMKRNPSTFKSRDRPVEMVSWEECSDFLKTLNGYLGGSAMRFLTEAEWEHACRAGTTTATWVGDLEILGENNAPVLDAIAWYGGNSGRGFDLPNGRDASGWPERQYPEDKVAGTRRVAQKQCNLMGFHDMLGNVWAWCSDGYEPYALEAMADPSGAAEGSYRVVRGGSWSDHARDVRAAIRFPYAPGIRNAFIGFRLARGQ